MEFALTLPLLLVVIAGIVDLGFAFQRHEVLTNAAREGARMAALPVGYTPDEVRERVQKYLEAGLAMSPAAADAALPYGQIDVVLNDEIDMGTFEIPTARVEIIYHHNWLLLRPILGLINKNWGTSITLRATSQMVREPGGGS